MKSVPEQLTQSSRKGYIDSVEEAEKILDNMMKYSPHELGIKADVFENQTLSSFILESSREMEGNTEGISLMLYVMDYHIIKNARLPWARLFSAITLDALFAVYSKRSTCGEDYSQKLADVKCVAHHCVGFTVTETTTVGEVLEKVRSKRKKEWMPGTDIQEYISRIIACYSIIKAILCDGPQDIYDELSRERAGIIASPLSPDSPASKKSQVKDNL